ncbi:hypothetical protein CROQUDRAFT_47471 [Cronartium quercuum f. sp. fusiforme G11]|uniref:Uncharacterized protein n=1 Tax=Cronartium quercuum f. sp. fusiforme G11 TaxID=708437 RepID=A0A9P6NHS0_9BASI|nr:hypothetical protein CROQUDRAFT_47471 [Cronartium quercuum f. sp. fusiforme G11]
MICLPVLLLLCQLATIKAGNVSPLELQDKPNVTPPPHPAPRRAQITASHNNSGFVYAKDGELYLGNRLFKFRGFAGPTLLDGTVFENTDLIKSVAGFATGVTRCYTLKVANDMFGRVTTATDAHITGWDKAAQDWTYNEVKWRQMDQALAIAADYKVKIIFPLINQDYGDDSSDWVGNYIDLIRHRFNISDYATAQLKVDWFTDRRIRDDFKKIIKKFLTRKNTVNGRIYGSDDTFLAFETGNEMNWANITVNNAGNNNSKTTNISLTRKPFQSLFVRMSFSTLSQLIICRNRLPDTRPAPAEWTTDIARYIKSFAPKILVMDGSLLNAQAKKYGKVFVIGEHGFYNTVASWAQAYKTITCAGALGWSIRPHAEINGFETHSESGSTFSYHLPGWPNSTAANFDPREAGIVRLTYEASFQVLNKPVGQYPVPDAPFPYFATNGSDTGISWKGAAWAQHYEIWGAAIHDKGYVKVAGPVYDNVDAGDLFIPIHPPSPTSPLEIPFKPTVNVNLDVWQDAKWVEHATVKRSMQDIMALPLLKRDYIPQASHLVRRKTASHHSSGNSKGGWYIVRGVSVNGIPGDFSKDVYIPYSLA